MSFKAFQAIIIQVSIYNMGILGDFGPKNRTRKIDKTRKEFEIYQVFMCNFLCKTVLIFLIYTLFPKRIEIF